MKLMSSVAIKTKYYNTLRVTYLTVSLSCEFKGGITQGGSYITATLCYMQSFMLYLHKVSNIQ